MKTKHDVVTVMVTIADTETCPREMRIPIVVENKASIECYSPGLGVL